jgi:hypothetical protein
MQQSENPMLDSEKPMLDGTGEMDERFVGGKKSLRVVDGSILGSK